MRWYLVFLMVLLSFGVVGSPLVFSAATFSAPSYITYEEALMNPFFFSFSKLYTPQAVSFEAPGVVDSVVEPVVDLEIEPVEMDELELIAEETTEMELENVIVEINQNKFHPEIIEVSVGQKVVWVNKRDRLPALIIGLREIVSMRSGLLNSGDNFSWVFNESGTFTYIDAIVVGQVAKIVVR